MSSVSSGSSPQRVLAWTSSSPSVPFRHSVSRCQPSSGHEQSLRFKLPGCCDAVDGLERIDIFLSLRACLRAWDLDTFLSVVLSSRLTVELDIRCQWWCRAVPTE